MKLKLVSLFRGIAEAGFLHGVAEARFLQGVGEASFYQSVDEGEVFHQGVAEANVEVSPR